MVKADVSPLASRAARGATSRVAAQRPSSRAPSSSRVSVEGRAEPGGRQRSQTAPPEEGEKAACGPSSPQCAQSRNDGA